MPLKLRRRRLVKRKRTNRKSKKLSLTKVTNLLRYVDVTGVSGMAVSGALTTAAGYLTHKTHATINTVNFGALSLNFKATDIPGVTEMQDMYEQYRINKITVKFIPLATSAAAGAAPTGGTTQTGIIFHWCLDYDDSALPADSGAGVNALRQRQGYRSRNVYALNGKPIVISFVPKVNIDNQPRVAGWFDEGNITVPHYGVKLITETVSTGAEMNHFFKVETTYHVSLKGFQ